MLDVKEFVVPFFKRILGWTLLYIFSMRVTNFSLTPYEHNLWDSPPLQILLQAFLKSRKQM